ncbi:SDR family oxidoreductase [Variovorax sp. PCZ-1]|uniref:SDR family NAD(P)-dependent oxidoreductase n=1 Tax=Variovorax sp. PCZ-1 TaxID=2835533 RepID=UPI001BCE132E|nr:SDR family oxidoreductase [Variovorax sp. PCZ-1]MBS7807818.1 SDR family oxidoreductase [Variovorax sp. PCZ-1]
MVTRKTTSRKSTSSQPGNYALITGASSGIGLELAKQIAAKGFDVILVARSVDKLQALAMELAAKHGIQARVAAADLTQSSSIQNLAAMLDKQNLRIRVLVNCAGVLHQDAFVKMEASKVQQMIDLNISALTSMLHAMLPLMQRTVAEQGGKAHVLNVASIAAYQPIPMLAAYAASKAYVLSLSESLAEELQGSGVSVTALCPGITATNMFAQAKSANDKLSQLPSFLIADVKEVASSALEAMLRGDAIHVPGAVYKVGVLASRSAPKWLVRKVGGLMGRKAM